MGVWRIAHPSGSANLGHFACPNHNPLADAISRNDLKDDRSGPLLDVGIHDTEIGVVAINNGSTSAMKISLAKLN